jgi:drug/metabolite transporter (DMT)-like permease
VSGPGGARSRAAAPALPGATGAPSLAARAPVALAVAGALTIAFSAILVKLADVAPATAAVFRCLYALPALWLLARREGPRPLRDRRLAMAAGVFFALDLVFWHQAIADVGAGLATVLGNLQIVFVGALAWMVLGERPAPRLLAIAPVVLAGVVLISGALEAGAYGANPTRGVVFGALTGLSYAGFILVLRQSTSDASRPAGPLFDATLVATAGAAAAGLAVGDVDLAPSWPAHGWLLLLALSSQVLGWLLISTSLPRLPAALSSVLLTIQPVGSVLLGVVLLGEDPTGLQLAGVALVLAGVLSLAVRRRPPVEPA